MGTWKVEAVLPESPLGEAGDFLGTETIRHVDGCTYESTTAATTPEGSLTITSRLIYDRHVGYLVRIDDDSRGFELLKVGAMRGDPGGYTSHHWEAPVITRQGQRGPLAGSGLDHLPLRPSRAHADLGRWRTVHELWDGLAGTRRRVARHGAE